MARADRGPSFEQRVARSGLTPQQAETARATLLLAELVDELCGLIREQNDRIAEQSERLAEQNRVLEDIRDRQPAAVTNYHVTNAAPAGPTDKGEGGGDVRLREPATPPPDPDDQADSGRAVAEPAAGKPAARRPATKAAAGKTAAKTTTAARRGTRETGGK